MPDDGDLLTHGELLIDRTIDGDEADVKAQPMIKAVTKSRDGVPFSARVE